MQTQEYFKDAKAHVWNGKFAIAKSDKTIEGAFANIIHKDEVTVIIDQSRIAGLQFLNIEKDWKILTIDVVFPIDVVGVTAKISDALAKAGVTIMPIASFSKDHFLIKEKDVDNAVSALSEIGIKVEKW
jgi:hypothetical protein